MSSNTDFKSKFEQNGCPTTKTIQDWKLFLNFTLIGILFKTGTYSSYTCTSAAMVVQRPMKIIQISLLTYEKVTAVF